MITPAMTEMSASDLFNTVGVNTMLVFMLLQFIAALLAIFIFRKTINRKTFKSLGFELSNYKRDLVKALIWGAGLISMGFIVLLSAVI